MSGKTTGKICDKHPELKGTRYLPSYACVGCTNERSKRSQDRTSKKAAAFDELLAALELYEAAREDIFGQCCSNPIKNAWGQEVNMLSFNLAHEAARKAIANAKGAAQ